MTAAPATADVLAELRVFVDDALPVGWIDAAERNDHRWLRATLKEVGIRSIIARVGAAGWVAPHWPVEHGGRALPDDVARAVLTQLDDWSVPRTPRGAGFVLAAPALRQYASDETQRRFLPKIVTGEEQWCQLFSEPGAGSDLASLSCSAVRDGDDWIVNGQKVWSTLAMEAQFGMLLARTDPTSTKNAGITYFAVDLGSPGALVRPLVQMTGETEFCEVFLDDVRIPDAHRISPVGKGWAASSATLSAERVSLSGGTRRQRATRGVLGGKTIDEVLEMASALGRGDDPLVRDDLARAYVDARVLALTVERGAAGGGAAGSVTKVSKARTNQQAQLLTTRMAGPGATAWEPDDAAAASVIREFLRTRANSIEGGTSEIQRNILGERILGLPREPDPYVGRPWNEIPRS